jgi:hypothetical protein
MGRTPDYYIERFNSRLKQSEVMFAWNSQTPSHLRVLSTSHKAFISDTPQKGRIHDYHSCPLSAYNRTLRSYTGTLPSSV